MNKLFFIALSLLAVVGCSLLGGKKTEGGFNYEVVRKGSGSVIPVNSYINYNMQIAYKDSIMQTISNTMKVEANPKNFGEFNALVGLFAKMHNGDSFHFYFPIDSFRQRPPGFENLTEPIAYRIGITNVMDEARFKAYSDSLMKADEFARQLVRDRLPEVEAMVNANYTAFKKGELNGQMKSTASGLRYIIHEEGSGPLPENGQKVSIHYYGMLETSGAMFDNSFNRGAPIDVVLGQDIFIPGWDEGIALLKKGTKATLYIPAAIGYGAEGRSPTIPPNANLIFYVEVLP